MEKQGMDRGKRSLRIGLLIFFTLLLPAAADEGDPPEVRIESSPASPIVNNPWSVFVLVKHPVSREVNVAPPSFPSSLILERVRPETMFVAPGERWTRVEFLFTPLRAGTITLPPFEVKTPAGQALTNRINVRFREASVRYEPRFRWLGPAPAVSPGEKAELVLELGNWDPGKKSPEGFFQGKAPYGTVVEEGLPQAAGEGVYRYTIGVIPLEESGVTLDAFSFHSDIYTLTVPGINVPILPAKETVLLNEIDLNDTRREAPRDFIQAAPFSQYREKVFFLCQREYNRIIAKVRTLWNENRRAEALAEIRKNERDSLSGPFLAALRREIEQEMNIGITENERWRPLKIPLGTYAVFFILLLSALVFLSVLRLRPEASAGFFSRFNKLKKKNVTFFFGNSFRNVIILVLTMGLALIFLEGNLGSFSGSGSSGSAVVLKSTQSYRIPDLKGAVNGIFDEGQPVIVGSYTGDWCLAETPDGRSGWVRRESIITY